MFSGKMISSGLLLSLSFATLLQFWVHTAPLSDDKSECMPYRNCPHVYNLVQNKSTKMLYGTTTLLSLIRCQNREQFQVKCISPAKTKDFIENANLIPNYENCGGLEISTKIVGGGTMTDLDEFPWIGLLRYRNSAGKLIYACHGNLINERYVLTAAHCVDPEILKLKKTTLYSVILGEYDIRNETDCLVAPNGSSDCTEGTKELLVENFEMHPNYDRNVFANDIALIRMRSAVEFSDFVKPICLPPPHLIAPFDETLWIAGWGSNEYNEMNDVKMKAMFVLRKSNSCDVSFRVTETQFCAGSSNNAQTCPGDSGGPLMMRRKIEDTYRLFLIGVDSLGVPCSTTNLRISIYTKVSSYIEWIITTIRK